MFICQLNERVWIYICLDEHPWIVCEMDFCRCGILIALCTVRGRHHDERENRFIRQIKFNFPNALAGKNLTPKSVACCWSNGNCLIGEMVWSEFRSLFKFKCYVRVSFEGSLDVKTLMQRDTIDSSFGLRQVVEFAEVEIESKPTSLNDFKSNSSRVPHRNNKLISLHNKGSSLALQLQTFHPKICNFHLSLGPFVVPNENAFTKR